MPTPAQTIHWLDRTRLDDWDHFASQHPLGGLTHNSIWQNIIEQAFPHIRGGYCVSMGNTSGAIRAGLPAYTVTSRLLGKRLVSIPFATLGDPLISATSEWLEILTALRAEARRQDATRIEIRCTHAPLPPPDYDWRIEKAFKHHVLRLDRTEADILAATHPRAIKAMILRGEKAGLTYRTDAGQASLQAFYQLFLTTRRRLALPAIPFAFFEAMHRHLAPRGILTYGLVEQGNTLLAAGLILTYGAMSTIEYLGDVSTQRREGSNQILYWGAIRDAIREGRTCFSFGRTAIGNEGLLTYKRRWGTQEQELTALLFPASTRPPSTTVPHDRWTYRAVRGLCAAAPMPLYRLIGHFCYRHLG